MKHTIAVFMAVTWALASSAGWPLYACAVCLGGASDATTDAFKWSVLFLMATPYVVASSIAGWLVYTYRRSAARQQSQEPPSRTPPQFAWNQEENGR